MIEKLNDAEKKYENINERLGDPAVVTNQEEFRALMKEHKLLMPVIEKFREYKEAMRLVQEAEELLSESNDAELKELAEEEYKSEKERCAVLFEELKILLLPRDENDDKNVIVEIRGGAGGEEAALFAGVLYRMYTMYADMVGFKTERMSANETELGGFKEISFMI